MLEINDEITYSELKEKIVGHKTPDTLLEDVLDNDTKLIKIGERNLLNRDGGLYMNDVIVSMTETVEVDISPRNDYNPAIANISIWVDDKEVRVVRYHTSRSHKTRVYEVDLFEIINDSHE